MLLYDVRISGGTYLDLECRNEEELKLRTIWMGMRSSIK